MESLIIVVLIHIQIHHLLLLESFLGTTIVPMVVALVGRISLTAGLVLIEVVLQLDVLDRS